MTSTNFLVLVCLFLSAALGLYTPAVLSQSYTTVATTTILVNTETEVVVSNTITTTPYEFTNYVWTMTGDSQHCISEVFPFEAASGDTINGTIISNNPSMVVYIVTDEELKAWQGQRNCDPRRSGIGIQWVNGSYPFGLLQQVNLDWTAPVAGQYWVLVETSSALTSIVTVNVTRPFSETLTQVLYLTQYSMEVDTISQTSQFVTVEQVPTLLQQGTLTLIGVAVLVVLMTAGYVIVKPKKPKSQTSDTQLKPTPTVTQATREKQFWFRCRYELAIGSKFCNKCGSKQP